MKIFLKSFLLLLILSIIGLQEGCQKIEGPADPQGETGQGITLKKGGFIQFTASGKRRDGSSFSYTRKLESYPESVAPCFYTTDNGIINWGITRVLDLSFLFTGSNQAQLSYYLDNGSGGGEEYGFSANLEEDLGNGNKHIVQINTYDNLNYSYQYNPATKKITGTFSGVISANNNSTNNDLTITNGSFESEIVNYVFRTKQ